MNIKNWDDLRYEIKFIADPTDNYIRIFLDTHPFAFKEVFHPRIIHNIYCDSELLSAYDENISGASERVKVRYRWYEDINTHEMTDITTELKYKNGKLGGKKFVKLNKKKSEISDLDMIKLATEKAPPELTGVLSTYSTPSMYNQYERTYFVSQDDKIRVTIDTSIMFSPLYIESGEKSRLDIRPFSIIEVKGAPADHQEISDFLKDFPYRPYRFSKYVVGIQNGIFS
tara:strand:- start:105871 stop:106554 length:684 start_codon:yes stop_codon:yes gene_type:complete